MILISNLLKKCNVVATNLANGEKGSISLIEQTEMSGIFKINFEDDSTTVEITWEKEMDVNPNNFSKIMSVLINSLKVQIDQKPLTRKTLNYGSIFKNEKIELEIEAI